VRPGKTVGDPLEPEGTHTSGSGGVKLRSSVGLFSIVTTVLDIVVTFKEARENGRSFWDQVNYGEDPNTLFIHGDLCVARACPQWF
jgi:hypothetical protein